MDRIDPHIGIATEGEKIQILPPLHALPKQISLIHIGCAKSAIPDQPADKPEVALIQNDLPLLRIDPRRNANISLKQMLRRKRLIDQWIQGVQALYDDDVPLFQL